MESEQCIYYPSRNNLSFETEEHVFPAGLGGTMKLPKGYVSKEFNNKISQVELRFMRESVIALPRQLLGPGKRGKLSVKYATKSTVHLIENLESPGTLSLGYIQLSKPFEIPQIRINQLTGELLCSSPDNQDGVSPQKALVKLLQSYDDKSVRYKEDDRLKSDELIVGFGDKIYVYKSPGNSFKMDNNYAKSLENSLTHNNSVPATQQFKAKTNQTVSLGDDFYRVCAKTALNALAMIKGKELVLRNEFDEIRDYIVNGGEKDPVRFGPIQTNVVSFPKDAHHVIISSNGSQLSASVSFYDHFGALVLLSSNFKGKISAAGYVCDWRNKREIPLMDYIAASITH